MEKRFGDLDGMVQSLQRRLVSSGTIAIDRRI